MKLKQLLRNYSRKKRRKRFSKYKDLIDENISLISNCCIAGSMYNTLSLRFLSPTINLYFGKGDFIRYASDLPNYTHGILEEDLEKSALVNHPVGLLRKDPSDNSPITIFFAHYHSFQEAHDKWMERTKRINFDKLFFIIEAVSENDFPLIDEYKKLPIKKIIFNKYINEPEFDVVALKYYLKNDSSKPITRYISIWGRRGYDEYDFVRNVFHKKNWN